jgi:riboflavin synthase
MFTGIIRYTGDIREIRRAGDGKHFVIQAPETVLTLLETGITSVALDGSCHTVEEKSADSFSVFSSWETLKRTTLDTRKSGDRLNLELPLTPSTLLDGHVVQGHVDGVGRILSVKRKGEAFHYRFSAGKELAVYLAEKDSIAIDGISLTLFDIDGDAFSVAVIPETANKTTLGDKSEGAPVNLEVNVFAKYAMTFAGRKADKNKKIEDWLKGG